MPTKCRRWCSRHGQARPCIVCPMCAPGMQPRHLCHYKCTSITRYWRLGRWTRCLRNEKVRGSSPLSSTIFNTALTSSFVPLADLFLECPRVAIVELLRSCAASEKAGLLHQCTDSPAGEVEACRLRSCSRFRRIPVWIWSGASMAASRRFCSFDVALDQVTVLRATPRQNGPSK
jgi:hypothetical protein